MTEDEVDEKRCSNNSLMMKRKSIIREIGQYNIKGIKEMTAIFKNKA